MDEKTKIALTYMALLATYGDDNNLKAEAFATTYSNNQEMCAELIKVELFYRELVASGIFGP